jgi:hypothetical protein
MAKDGTRRIETRTIERVPIKGDAFQGAVRDAIGNPGKLAIDGYCDAIWAIEEVEALIAVYKMTGPGGYTKKGELTHREYQPKEVEPYMMGTWGPGRYQLRVNLNGRYYSPVSVVYSVGEEDDRSTSTSGGDVDGAITEAAKRIGNIQALEKLNDITSPNRGGLDLAGIAALLTAMKPDNAAVTASLDAANRRAEAAEVRNHELMLKMMEGRQGLAAGAAPLFGELFKYLKPEHLSMLMNPATADKPWWETVAELAREFAPALQAVVVKLMEQSGVATPAMRALAPSSQPPEADKMSAAGPSPAPTDGGSTMPLPLNDEQQYAKGIMLEYIKGGDWPNALAALENFPGFVPSDAGPMPMGVAMISRIDPKVNPRIYIGQLLMLMPELKGLMPQAQAFIEHIQKRILADDEEAARQQNQPPPPPGGPDPYRPTRAEGGE